VIPIIGGLTAAVLWGLSTVVASRSTKILGSQEALAWVLLLGGAAVLVIAPLTGAPAHLTPGSAAWAVVGGVGSTAGLSTMYRALRIGKVGIVSPIASTEGALAAVFAIALGERLTVGVAVSLAVIAAGVVVVTLHGRRDDVHMRPSVYALLAACCFGAGLVGSAKAGHDLGPLWTILAARLIGVAAIAGPLVARRRLTLPGRPALWMVAFSAFAELTGFVAYIGGARTSVAIAAVLGSQFAAVATVTSYVAFGERLERRQAGGAAVIVAGVAALSLLRA
jgi:drug/metabolite transporter (DMT)-like permease